MGQYKQTATHWASSGQDRDGADTYAAPVLLAVRWEDRQETALTPSGEEFTSQAIVFVQQDVSVGDYLALGDHHTVTDPRSFDAALADAKVVRTFIKVPDLRNVRTERRALL